MSRSTIPSSVFRVLGFSLLSLPLLPQASGTEATVLTVRRSGDGSSALLLKVPDNAEVSAQDLSAALDATQNSPRAKAALNGRRFGELTVVSPPPIAKRRTPVLAAKTKSPARTVTKPSPKPLVRTTPPPAPAKPVKPAKPDVTIFERDEPKGSAAPAKPAPVPAPGPEDKPAPAKP